MKPPEGWGMKMYLTLLSLYADQENVRITGELECDGVTVKFDTDEPISMLSYEEIVKRYGKTKTETEQELE